MGLVSSVMGGKVSTNQLKNVLYDKLYEQFIEDENKEIKDFEAFHTAILRMITAINNIIPGKHYEVPGFKDIQDEFKNWEAAEGYENKKKVVRDFIENKVHMRKVDPSMYLTGLAAPPAAMALKRAGESLPQLKIIKLVPDLIFVPSGTLVALVGCRLASTWNRVKR